MRRGEPVSIQVYKVLFPRPVKNIHPSSWNSHVKSNLLPEIKVEIDRFYDRENLIEKRYPGVNYAYPPHRLRLNCNSFPHHQQLFKAFDKLDLTETEIYELCNWEYTLYARRKVEKEHNVRIEDTTGDDVAEWVEPSAPQNAVMNDEGQVDVEMAEEDDDEGEEEELDTTPKAEHDTDDAGVSQRREQLSATLGHNFGAMRAWRRGLATEPPRSGEIQAARERRNAALDHWANELSELGGLYEEYEISAAINSSAVLRQPTFQAPSAPRRVSQRASTAYINARGRD